MNLILLGYCANLAYVIYGNSFGVLFDKKPCQFGMVPFGIVTYLWKLSGIHTKVANDRVKRENSYGQ